MSKITNNTTIKDNEMVNNVRGAIGHRSTWMALTYLEGKKAGKAEEAEEFARKAIAKTGERDGEKFRSLCSSENIDCKEFADIFLSDTTRKCFEIEFKEMEEDRLDMEFHHCPLLKAWQDLGIDDETCSLLCSIAMEGDRGIARGMGLDFDLRDTIADGKPTCQITFYKKK